MRRRRTAFTLVELLVVVVIIGILAAFAIPQFRNTKGKAHAAALRTDLRNLATAEESFFYSNGHYTLALDSVPFKGSPGVVVTLSEASTTGWSANATHPESYPLKCAVFMGNASPVAPATSEGVISCK
jgi:prepilin-type N-terminal cleavage/methylation domain-containing protein